eukprot:1154750-Pelagomonas_calceolata.AAC.5
MKKRQAQGLLSARPMLKDHCVWLCAPGLIFCVLAKSGFNTVMEIPSLEKCHFDTLTPNQARHAGLAAK